MQSARRRAVIVRRVGDERGQDTVEYVGVVAVVAVVVAIALGVVQDGFAAPITDGVRTEVCRIFQGRCASPRGRSGRTTVHTDVVDPTAPHSGPPIGHGQPFPVLPFPGTTASGTLKGGGGHASAQVQAVISRGNPTLKMTSAGCGELEQLQIATSVSVAASTKGDDEGSGDEGDEGDGTGGSGSVSAGVELNTSYALNVSPAEASKIQYGAAAPNPVDPRSLTPGESIVLNQGTYKTLGLSGAYGVLQGEVNYKSGPQVTTGITALPDGEVRVYVGNGNLVQNALQAGIGNDDVGVSIGSTDTQTSANLRAVTIDLNSASGWTAYQQFLHSGRIPGSSTSGVSDAITQETYDDSQTISAGARLLGFSVGKTWNPEDLSLTTTHGPDGTTTTVADRSGGVTAYESADPGHPATYSLLLQGTDATSRYNFAQSTGQSAPRSGPTQDMQMTFTAAQLNGIQQQADAQIGASLREDGKPPMNAQQVHDYIEAHPGQLPPGTRGEMDSESGISDENVAIARNPSQILEAIQLQNDSSGADELEALAGFELRVAEETHPKARGTALVGLLHPISNPVHGCTAP